MHYYIILYWSCCAEPRVYHTHASDSTYHHVLYGTIWNAIHANKRHLLKKSFRIDQFQFMDNVYVFFSLKENHFQGKLFPHRQKSYSIKENEIKNIFCCIFGTYRVSQKNAILPFSQNIFITA